MGSHGIAISAHDKCEMENGIAAKERKDRKKNFEASLSFGGARLLKDCSFQKGESVDTIDLIGWVDRRAEPCPSAGPRLGALFRPNPVA